MAARSLKDMVVVITGASAGIGRAVAEECHRRGARLVLAARRMEKLEELNQSLGGQHLCVAADVAKTEDCRRLIDESVQHFGRVDTLICNAGYGIYRRLWNTPIENVRAIFATNVFGTTDCITFALPSMLKQERRDGWRGQIMIVSSVVGRRGIPFLSYYSATKAAQFTLAEALRVELRPYRIAVTSVHPIQTRTEFGAVATTSAEIQWPESPMDQTVDHVARKMVDAIARPKPEVWPSRMARWLFNGGTFVPRLFDAALSNYRKKVERKNPSVRPD